MLGAGNSFLGGLAAGLLLAKEDVYEGTCTAHGLESQFPISLGYVSGILRDSLCRLYNRTGRFTYSLNRSSGRSSRGMESRLA